MPYMRSFCLLVLWLGPLEPPESFFEPYSLGKLGIWLNLIGFVFLTFASITFNSPSVAPVDKHNMNYTCVAVGVIGIFSLLTWIFGGRKSYTGPQTGEWHRRRHGSRRQCRYQAMMRLSRVRRSRTTDFSYLSRDV